MNRVSGEILQTEALLSQHRAGLGILTNNLAVTGTDRSATNGADRPPELPIPNAKIAEYRAILAQLDTLNRREGELTMQFKPESPFVRAVRRFISEQERRRQNVETEFPGIEVYSMVGNASSSRSLQSASHSSLLPNVDPTGSISLVRSLEAKLITLRDQMAQLQSNGTRLAVHEAEITELQRRKEIEEKQYTYHYNALEQARVDEALNQNKISGLSVLENPTPAAPNADTILKAAAGLGAGGILIGIAWALFSKWC